MKYTESTSLEEIGRWMDAGLEVEFYSVNHIWTEPKKEAIYATTRYRLVEEEEKPVAREGWVHPDDIKDPSINYNNAMLRVRILEDE